MSAGDDEVIQVEGTEMPDANGIETSPDGREVYVASTAQEKSSNVTLALELDDELWKGTAAGNRIVYLPL